MTAEVITLPDLSGKMTEMNKKIFNLTDEDIFYSYTPDLPKLRYSGMQHVFLWDQAANMSNILGRLNLRLGRDIRFATINAVTNANFYPLIDAKIIKDMANSYVSFGNRWLGSLDDELKTKLKGRLLPIKGKLFKVGINGLKAIDLYYQNTVMCRRMLENVTVSMNDEETVQQAWVYRSTSSAFLKYDPHKQVYGNRKDSDLIEAPIVKYKGKEVYELVK